MPASYPARPFPAREASVKLRHGDRVIGLDKARLCGKMHPMKVFYMNG